MRNYGSINTQLPRRLHDILRDISIRRYERLHQAKILLEVHLLSSLTNQLVPTLHKRKQVGRLVFAGFYVDDGGHSSCFFVLPRRLHGILRNISIGSYQRQIFVLRLGNEHSVKRVFMQWR